MAVLFKFRCYQCQKLIGAPPSRFGKVVKCPRCGVELIVPSPDDQEPSDEGPPDADAFRLEDLGLRLDPEPLLTPSTTPPPPLEPVGPDPIAFLEHAAASGDTPGAEIPDGVRTPPAEPPEDSGEPSDLPQPQEEPLVPRRRGRRGSDPIGPSIRARDVVLPRTAAVAWALFALLALAFAFTSGLFVGHTLWK